MKIGTEERKKAITAAVLVAVAILLALYTFRGFFVGSDASAAPSAPSVAPQSKPGVLSTNDSSDPRLRLDVLDASRKVKYEEGGRNIFKMEENIPTIEASVRTQIMGPPSPPVPTPPPTPPPIPIKYYGFASKTAEPRRIFLQQQGVEQIFVAEQGDIVARRYRVVQITQNSVTMEDVLTGNRQPILLTAR